MPRIIFGDFNVILVHDSYVYMHFGVLECIVE